MSFVWPPALQPFGLKLTTTRAVLNAVYKGIGHYEPFLGMLSSKKGFNRSQILNSYSKIFSCSQSGFISQNFSRHAQPMKVGHSAQKIGSRNGFGSAKVVIYALLVLGQTKPLAQPISTAL
jgi:hypothetical protein